MSPPSLVQISPRPLYQHVTPSGHQHATPLSSGVH